MNFRRHFFIEGAYLGHSDEPAIMLVGRRGYVAPTGHSLFCCACARVWAEMPVEGQWSRVWDVTCERHKPGERIGGFGREQTGAYMIHYFTPAGSVWRSWDQEAAPLETFPAPVIERELRIHLAWAAGANSVFPPHIASAAQNLLQSLSA